MEILVLGVERVVVVKLEESGDYLNVKYRVLSSPQDGGSEVEALSRALLELAGKAIQLAQTPIRFRTDAHVGRERRSAAAGLFACEYL